MNKQKTIITYFDRSNELTIANPLYKKQVTILTDFFLSSDEVKNDISTKLIRKSIKNAQAIATVVAKQDGIIAGIEESLFIIGKKSCIIVDTKKTDGAYVKKEEVILYLHGKFDELLTLERTVLNIMQRMSGIATETHHLIKSMNSKTRVAATRKTLWGWLDKKAVAIGGGLTHRLSLGEGILIKDSHLDLISNNKLIAIEKMLEQIKESEVKAVYEIEVNTYQQAIFTKKWWQEVMGDVPLIIMLDNFTVSQAKKTVKAIKNENIVVELSGGITASNIKKYGNIRADVISLGSLTHSSESFDMSLRINL